MSKILHIPCGFRCFTQVRMKHKFGIQQASLPFDSGFFSGSSIIKFMESDKFEINLNNTNPCIKTENYIKDNKKGVKFKEVDYNLINQFIKKNRYDDSYLDTTKGYYTLCKEFGWVLAHYNWHPSSKRVITNPDKNIPIINKTLNRRRTRLCELINLSSEINLYFFNKKDLHSLIEQEFLIINDKYHNIKEESALLENYFKQKYANKKINSIYL